MALWNEAKFEQWDKETQIPESITEIVDIICDRFGIDIEECLVEHHSVYGDPFGVSKGYRLCHCTSSYADGPSQDMTPTFLQWLGGLGFNLINSYGDNGLDYSTNRHDTFWWKEIAYMPSFIDYDAFYDHGHYDEH